MRAWKRGAIWVAQVWTAGIWVDIPHTEAATAYNARMLGEMMYSV